MTKKKVIIRDAWDYTDSPSDYENVDPRSKTIPDEAMSISEILQRFSQGVLSDVQYEGHYTDTDDFDDHDPELLDLLDVKEFIEINSTEKGTPDKTTPIINTENKEVPNEKTDTKE